MPISLNGNSGITTPGITNTGAQTVVDLTTSGNTIIGDASTDTLNVGNGGLVKDAAGSLGLGVTPSASTLFKTMELGTVGNIIAGRTGNSTLVMGANWLYNSGFKYANNGTASQYETTGGAHYWYNAASGTAGNAISFTQAMTLEGTDRTNLLVGGTSAFTAAANRGNISLNGTTDAIFAIGTGGTRRGYIYADSAHIEVVADGYMALAAGGAERARITSAGNVGIGTTAPSCALDVTKAAGANFVATFQNTTAATPYCVFIKDAASSTAGYPLLAVTDSTGNSTYLRVDSSTGNVGIGTSSPVARNHLRGSGTSGQVTASFILENSSSGTAGMDITGSAGASRLRFLYGGGPSTGTNALTEAMCLLTEGASAGNVGIGSSAPLSRFETIGSGAGTLGLVTHAAIRIKPAQTGSTDQIVFGYAEPATHASAAIAYVNTSTTDYQKGALIFATRDVVTNTAPTERVRINPDGSFYVGTTSFTDSDMGFRVQTYNTGRYVSCSSDAIHTAVFNRNTDDGTIVDFRQAGTAEGSISVSGTTVSYNGGHLSRWAQTTTAKDESIVKGTVLSNLDAMNVYTKDGQSVDNEQLNKVKVSDVEGDANVAGVFVNWSHDEDHNVDEINMAMTGDMIIRIAQGTTVVRGDLLMSAGDGTAKPQGDDIVRSKTVAKVTSNHITCTYADGSYCVPCVLMAC